MPGTCPSYSKSSSNPTGWWRITSTAASFPSTAECSTFNGCPTSSLLHLPTTHPSPGSTSYPQASWPIWRRSRWGGETSGGFAISYFPISPTAEKAKTRSRCVRPEKCRPRAPGETEEKGTSRHRTTVRFAKYWISRSRKRRNSSGSDAPVQSSRLG